MPNCWPMRFWGISRLAWHIWQETTKQSAPALEGPFIEALHQGVDDIGPGHGQAGAAAVGLEGPVQGLGAQYVQEPLQVLGVFRLGFLPVTAGGRATMQP